MYKEETKYILLNITDKQESLNVKLNIRRYKENIIWSQQQSFKKPQCSRFSKYTKQIEKYKHWQKKKCRNSKKRTSQFHCIFVFSVEGIRFKDLQSFSEYLKFTPAIRSQIKVGIKIFR